MTDATGFALLIVIVAILVAYGAVLLVGEWMDGQETWRNYR